MKEKIRKILTIDRGVVYGDFPGLIAYLEALFNQEVEKRIAERMPSEGEIIDESDDYGQRHDEDNYGYSIYGITSTAFKKGAEWFRSRLTSSEKPNNSRGDK